MSNLNRDGKIYFIMRAIGVAKSDMERTKAANYDGLSDHTLNHKYQAVLADMAVGRLPPVEEPLTVRTLLDPL